MQKQPDKIKIIQALFLAISICFGLLLLYRHGAIVSFPHQLEMREVAILQSTQAMADGVNVFSSQNWPQYLNVYGFVYHLVCIPFVLIFDGNSLLVHKAISSAFLLATVVFFYFLQRHYRISAPVALGSTLVLYCSLLFGVHPLPRPDALGMLLFLLIVGVPAMNGYSSASLFLSCVLAVLAFFTKMYFVFGAVIVLSYVFCFVSKKKALVAGLFFAMLFAVFAGIVNTIFPDYFYAIFLLASNSSTYTHYYVLLQLKDLLFNHNVGYTCGAVLFAVISIFRHPSFLFKANLAVRRIRFRVNFLSLDRPLLEAIKLSMPFFANLVVLFVMLVRLGGHGGSYMTYWFQLFLPFFILWVNAKLTQYQGLGTTLYGIVCVSMFTSFRFLGSVPKNHAKFELIEQRIEQSEHAFVTPSASYAQFKLGEPLVDNGMSIYMLYINYAKSGWPQRMFPRTDSMKALYERYVVTQQELVNNSQYDLIVTTSGTPRSDWCGIDSMIRCNYYCYDTMQLEMPQNLENFQLWFWSRKTLK